LAPKDKSERIWWGARRISHLGPVLLRHLRIEIGRRGWARGTVLKTFVSGVHNPKIMLGMLVKVLCGDSIVICRRLARKGNVTFEDLMRGTSDFDARPVTIEGLTSVRYLLPITVGIVTVIAAMRSAGLSCSHDTGFIAIRGDSGRAAVQRAPLRSQGLSLPKVRHCYERAWSPLRPDDLDRSRPLQTIRLPLASLAPTA